MARLGRAVAVTEAVLGDAVTEAVLGDAEAEAVLGDAVTEACRTVRLRFSLGLDFRGTSR